MNDAERPPLLHGQRLLRGDLPDWKNNACPHWHAGSSNWGLISDGYQKAASSLVDRVVEGNALADEMLYPVGFLYRHYLELCLKEITYLGARIDPKMQRPKPSHKLDELWGQALIVLECHVLGLTAQDLATIGEQIRELQAIDPGSDGFRYPVDKKNATALAGLQHVNLRHMRDAMKGIAYVLDGVITYLWEAKPGDQ